MSILPSLLLCLVRTERDVHYSHLSPDSSNAALYSVSSTRLAKALVVRRAHHTSHHLLHGDATGASQKILDLSRFIRR